MKVEKVLFPTDFSRCADQALLHAVHIARRYGAELHMLHVVVLHDYDPHNPRFQFPDIDGRIENDVADAAGGHLQAMVDPQETAELVVHEIKRRGFAAAPAILEYAEQNGVDLIVMGTHGRRGLGQLLLGSAAEEVVRLAGCPVLTVKEQQEALTVEAVQKILVPVDFSEYSARAIGHACELAIHYTAGLQLLHVVERNLQPSFYATGKSPLDELQPEMVKRSRAELAMFYEEHGDSSLDVEYLALEGVAARDIVQLARDRGSNLIVIATHGLTGIEHLLIGSVTEKVVRMAPCPVLTVKAFDRNG